MAKEWLGLDTLRIALGCIRLSTDDDSDDERTIATIAAAVGAGITLFDTARAQEGNERLLVRAQRGCGASGGARIVTRGRMARPGGAWVLL